MKYNERNVKPNDVNGTTRVTRGSASGRGARKDSQVVIQRKPYQRVLKIGTWNVRTMLPTGKLENVKREMERAQLNILGLSEVRWKGEGDFTSDDIRVIYGGGKESQRGVAVLLDKETAKSVIKVIYHSDRLLLVKLKAEPVDLLVIQVYMPTSAYKDEEIDNIYDEIEELIEAEKGSDNLIIMGDWNAVVGEGIDQKEVGSFGLGERNSRGQKLVEFCKRRKMVVANTLFSQPKRRRYTWIKPGDTGRYQIDYILVRSRYRNSVKNCHSYPGADVYTDHILVAMKCRTKLKKVQGRKKIRKWDLERLSGPDCEQFQEEITIDVKDHTRGNQQPSVNDRWDSLKGTILKSAQNNIGYKKGRAPKKPWVTNEMIQKMDERRRWKRESTEKGRKMYKKLNNQLRRETDKAKEKWWEKQCRDLEELERIGRSDLVYSRVRELTEKPKISNQSSGIKDKDGQLLSETDKIKKRWKEYIEELYDKEGKPTELEIEMESQIDDDSKGPDILDIEITSAIEVMKNKKAEGVDGIPAEMLKNLGDQGTEELKNICKQIYSTGEWPDDFTKAIMIPLQKKQNATECGDHRTISLISHASKIILRVLNRRIESKASTFIGKSQFGFRQGRGTREAIGVMRMLSERSLDHDNELFVCFVDFEKAFDRVNWTKLLNIMAKIGVDWRDRRLISSLYMNQEAVVRLTDVMSDPSEIGRGVRQGCLLSPVLFSIYVEMMMIEAMGRVDEGVVVGGELMKDVRFADDQAMIASSEKGLQKLMDSLNERSKAYDMKIHVKKTKVMKISRKGGGEINIFLEGQKVEQVKQFKYLGSLLTEDGKSKAEIRARIGMAKTAFNKKKVLLTKTLSKDIKKRIIKAVVWSVALYGAETWTLQKEEVRRLEAFEMWVWRRMEKVSWKEKKTNVEVLAAVGEERSLIRTIGKRKKNWMGHILRTPGMMRDVIEGRMEGKRPRGRKRIGMLDELKDQRPYAAMKRRAEDRSEWRRWEPWTCLAADN